MASISCHSFCVSAPGGLRVRGRINRNREGQGRGRGVRMRQGLEDAGQVGEEAAGPSEWSCGTRSLASCFLSQVLSGGHSCRRSTRAAYMVTQEPPGGPWDHWLNFLTPRSPLWELFEVLDPPSRINKN